MDGGIDGGVWATERGIYAASISPDISTLKRAKARAPAAKVRDLEH